ncbi:M-phase inducer phosphatase [Uncinocarpus reesii 1704]|uniref:M-phase inducer phosphatase n=1 Tax=Uncinocarpus reesii (strain UAMH 1704) TaxID=336963 RepID=C4JFZ6_UNCRE|nr:M-phase inducer phosphatase [Uncinocarpus reesii 1704]EEP76227.1 M-phase inducer phosphatase [Uncinocarpus reesii 1704]
MENSRVVGGKDAVANTDWPAQVPVPVAVRNTPVSSHSPPSVHALPVATDVVQLHSFFPLIFPPFSLLLLLFLSVACFNALLFGLFFLSIHSPHCPPRRSSSRRPPQGLVFTVSSWTTDLLDCPSWPAHFDFGIRRLLVLLASRISKSSHHMCLAAFKGKLVSQLALTLAAGVVVVTTDFRLDLLSNFLSLDLSSDHESRRGVPPSVMFGHHFRSEGTNGLSFPAIRKFGPESFNFRDLSMKTGHSDYFNTNPLRGSSPTVTLAADLSQNFHIDRRLGFRFPHNRNIYGQVTASSGPTLLARFSHGIRTSWTSTVGPPPSRSLLNFYWFLTMFNRRPRPPILRPSLMRSKAYSSGEKGSLAPQPPPFKFAAGNNPSSRPSLACNTMGPPRPRAPLSGVVGQCRSNGSPVNGIRKSSNPFSRPRKQCRRSLSMFEHPDDVINQDEDTMMLSSPVIQSIADMDTQPTLQLPHFIPEDGDQLPRIEINVLVDIINGKYNDLYDNISIIDCRFEYEYEGGHINGAVNYNDKEQLAAKLFEEGQKSNTALIFHCEYSAHRAPIMAKFIRHKDRAINVDIYPKLTYPEMYILHGGYSAFFAEHRCLCQPQNYVEMSAKEHEFACERGLGRVKQRSKLSRAQTFAFGQNSLQVEESPTGRCRLPGDRSSEFDSPFDRDVEVTRLPGRRMFSY